jgi:DNA-binding beta-propeller fold protein YncE
MQTVHVRGRTYNYAYTIGRQGAGGNGFSWVHDIALDHNQNLYVVCRGDEFQPAQRITVCTLEEEFVREIVYGAGYDDGQFLWPTSVAVDKAGNVYVSDEWLNRITVFDSDGKFVSKWGQAGSAEGQLGGPAGIIFDKDENLYITENRNNRVQKFTKDGQFLSSWGSEGSGSGQFNQPWGITIDGDGDVYVADWHNHRVQKFSPDGAHMMTIGTPGDEQGQLRFPADVAVDRDGDIYVTNWWSSTVEVFDSSGDNITTFIGNSENLSKWAQESLDANPDMVKARLRVPSLEPEWRFTRPTGIVVDNQGRILVGDGQRHRVQIYQKEDAWVEPQFNL